MANQTARLLKQSAQLLLFLSLAFTPLSFARPQSSSDSAAVVSSIGAGLGGSRTHSSNSFPANDYLSEAGAEGLYCWPIKDLPVKVYFQPADGIEGYRSTYPQILAGCFDEWVRASGLKLGWIQVAQPQAANIIVRWTRHATESEQGTEAGRTKTYATYNTVTNKGTIHKAEMTLLTRLLEREFQDSEIRRAYLHEVGHAFGIAGHSSEPDDIMFFAVRKNEKPHLSDRDVATINRLYSGYQTMTSNLDAPLDQFRNRITAKRQN